MKAGSTERGESLSEKPFRLQDLEIWKRGALINGPLFALADELDQKRFYRFAEQLRSATLSLTNNIAGESGRTSKTDFANFLNSARRSVFEVAKILILLSQHNKRPAVKISPLLNDLEEESRLIPAFIRHLKS